MLVDGWERFSPWKRGWIPRNVIILMKFNLGSSCRGKGSAVCRGIVGSVFDVNGLGNF